MRKPMLFKPYGPFVFDGGEWRSRFRDATDKEQSHFGAQSMNLFPVYPEPSDASLSQPVVRTPILCRGKSAKHAAHLLRRKFSGQHRAPLVRRLLKRRYLHEIVIILFAYQTNVMSSAFQAGIMACGERAGKRDRCARLARLHKVGLLRGERPEHRRLRSRSGRRRAAYRSSGQPRLQAHQAQP